MVALPSWIPTHHQPAMSGPARYGAGMTSGPAITAATPATLAAADIAFLHRHGSVPGADPATLARLDARSRARDEADQAASYTAAEATALTGLSAAALRRLVARGALLARRGEHGGPLTYPDWQFTEDGHLLPHLADVLHAMPQPAPPVTARAFITTPTTDLNQDPDAPATAMSPAQWIADGQGPGPVVALAATMGEQV